MTIWKAGMLAVYVVEKGGSLKFGQPYRVTEVLPPVFREIGLVIEGRQSTHPTGAYRASSFRPAILDNKSADTEFKQQIDTIVKRRVSA